MLKRLEYTDIGHVRADSLLWVWSGRLDVRPVSEGTHNSIYGMAAMGMWRGRYEPDTGRCSIAPPITPTFEAPPEWLIVALETKWVPIEPYFFGLSPRTQESQSSS